MRLGRYVKSPDEAKRYSVEYVDWLDTGEYLQSVTFEISPISTGGELYAVAANIGASATKFIFFVTGGTENIDYEITVQVTTTGNQIKEDTILFSVRAPQ